ncbi:MAG TPA: nitroreductase family protein [Candidatus Cloacimonadota bacterium]|nr:nitroreductase family protein [Candidatus Cloacimonadota bacterium]
MKCMDVILSRQSVRSFSDEPVPEEIIDQILEAGRWAPSTQNRQPWRFIVIKDREIIRKLAVNSGFIGLVNHFIRDAAFVIVACAEPKEDMVLNGQPYYLVDTAIALQQMVLAAWSFGIGSCWLGAFSETSVKAFLDIPDSIRVIAITPFGYPKDRKSLYSKAVSSFAGSRKRRPKEDIFYINKWRKK